jgi:ABC-type amino acid transport substrate-binding protein
MKARLRSAVATLLLLAFIGDLTAAPILLNTVPVAPWTFPNNPERGIAPEYLRFLFDAANIKVRFGTVPYLRVINGLRDGGNSAAILIPDPERDNFAIRLCKLTTIHAGLAYKKSRFSHLEVSGLSKLTIGIQHGTHALDKLAAMPGQKTYTVQSVEQGLKMLQINRLDATFLSSPGSESVLRDNGMQPDEYGWLEIDVSPVVVYVSRKAALANDSIALARLKGLCEGPGQAVIKQLVRKYR